MKKKMFIAIAIMFSTASAFAAPADHDKTTADTTKKTKPAKIQYTCTMHPEVIADKPGKCPKCGMTLVKKTDTKKKPAEKMKM